MSKDINEALTKFIESKQKLSEIEKRVDKYREIVDNYMKECGKDSLEHLMGSEKYVVKRTSSSRESISKKDLPPEIWQKYYKTSRFSVINISKK
jgi:hypothetical protein